MTFNLHFRASKKEMHSSINLINKYKPDILCFQELTSAFAREFRKRLGRIYKYRFFRPRSGTWGIGIASRYRFFRRKKFRLLPYRMPGLEAKVLLPGRRLWVSCVHFFPPFAKRRGQKHFFQAYLGNARLRIQQSKYLLRRYKRKKQPFLLLGDFNEGSSGAAMRVLKQGGLKRACQQVRRSSCASTWHTSFPLWKVDHILGKHLYFQKAWTLRGGGSDHFPVLATFRFQK